MKATKRITKSEILAAWAMLAAEAGYDTDTMDWAKGCHKSAAGAIRKLRSLGCDLTNLDMYELHDMMLANLDYLGMLDEVFTPRA